jgi:hypothetical protein
MGEEGEQCAETPLEHYVPDLQMTRLFVANVLGGSGPIQGKQLQLPFDRDGRRQVARRFVASLILKLPRDRDNCSVVPN